MATIWFLLILLCLLMYVVLDGYDLGLGIATLIEPDAGHRHEMLEQVAQVWDGNETWLVLLGVSLWAGFPAAFGAMLPHAYLPVIVMLFALIVRGVSVEMASQTHPAPRWEKAFGIASLVAALAQGVAATALIDAIGWFSGVAGVTVACLYLALGYAYLRRKAAGEARVHAGRRGKLSAVVASVLVVVCLIIGSVLDLHGPALTSNPAPRSTLEFLVVGIGVNVPLILFYNWFAHHAFRGKPAVHNRTMGDPR
jgi:cytochrome d ubiquinol oxidase subunit II